jgi:hypothetical protein
VQAIGKREDAVKLSARSLLKGQMVGVAAQVRVEVGGSNVLRPR